MGAFFTNLLWRVGNRPFDLDVSGTRFHFLTGIGYSSMYILGPEMPLQLSEGSVVVTKLNNDIAEGCFNIKKVGVGDQFKPETTVLGTFRAKFLTPGMAYYNHALYYNMPMMTL